MRALALTQLGGPEHLAVLELPGPAAPAAQEVVVRVRCAALNRLDLFLTEGVKGITLSFPHVVGTDGAGIIEQLGDGVRSVQVGDRVTLNPGISCGECALCQAGEEPFCRQFQILGEHRPGTAAEFVTVPERNVAKIPEGMPWPVAAAFPLSTLTAWRMLRTRAKLQTGETVLIWGAGGGVALAALQVAKLLGARAIVTGSSETKLAKARELGADVLFNHAAQPPEEIARAIRKLTGTGADVVVDSVGQRTWEASLRSLRPGGRLVTCGATSGPEVLLDIRRLFWFQWSLLGSTMGTAREFAEVMTLAAAGKLWPVIDSVVPLEHARSAYERMARGEQLGKLVIEVSA
ncbi:MAG TPA: zinc-binding dehydrogenase [Gemmatimonadales bacterium]|jgi:NADPH:quinone reductase-like Zn-dependent oxidoreductase|nr:zinc-binding dehydrogenase [Gemmatimonadales bacterium]